MEKRSNNNNNNNNNNSDNKKHGPSHNLLLRSWKEGVLKYFHLGLLTLIKIESSLVAETFDRYFDRYSSVRMVGGGVYKSQKLQYKHCKKVVRERGQF